MNMIISIQLLTINNKSVCDYDGDTLQGVSKYMQNFKHY